MLDKFYKKMKNLMENLIFLLGAIMLLLGVIFFYVGTGTLILKIIGIKITLEFIYILFLLCIPFIWVNFMLAKGMVDISEHLSSFMYFIFVAILASFILYF